MKNLITIALALILALSLAACGAKDAVQDAVRGAMSGDSQGSGADSEAEDTEDSEEAEAPGSASEAEPEDDGGGEKVSEADVVGASVENTVLVARYIGDSAMYGAARQYTVMEYFNEDGTIDEMWGTSKMLFFYDDEASYDAGFADASKGGAGYIKEENKASLYFATSGGISNGGDWASFGELEELIESKSQRNPEYSQYEIVR
jgi:hypothetical protein